MCTKMFVVSGRRRNALYTICALCLEGAGRAAALCALTTFPWRTHAKQPRRLRPHLSAGHNLRLVRCFGVPTASSARPAMKKSRRCRPSPPSPLKAMSSRSAYCLANPQPSSLVSLPSGSRVRARDRSMVFPTCGPKGGTFAGSASRSRLRLGCDGAFSRNEPSTHWLRASELHPPGVGSGSRSVQKLDCP